MVQYDTDIMPSSYTQEKDTDVLRSPTLLTSTLARNTAQQDTPTVFALTGGCGFVGERLALYLLEQYTDCYILLLDIVPPCMSSILYTTQYKQYQDANRIIYRHCDLTNYACLQQSLAKWNDLYNITCIVHIASYGMSGREMLDHKRTTQVNVGGTQSIIELCKQLNIKQLIYISTYNTVFGGQPLPNMNESCPYYPTHLHNDAYSRTKCIAEQLVLSANNTKCNDGTTVLHTCALRPAAIYGDGEKKHYPRIFKTLDTGFGSLFYTGGSDNLVDWLYVDNLVYAIQCAVKRVDTTAAGQVYFISDCHPISNFGFINEIATRLNYPYCFTVRLPMPLMMLIARCFELVHHVIHPYMPHQEPYLTRTEVLKVGTTHYADCSKAKNELGYMPVVSHEDAVERTASYYKDLGYGYKPYSWTKRILKIVVLMYVLTLMRKRYMHK